MIAHCVYADLYKLLFFMNNNAKNIMPPMMAALIVGNCIAATMTATMTNTIIKFDIRFANSGPNLSELLVSCLNKNR